MTNHKRNHQFWRAFLALIVAAIILASCSSEASEDDPESDIADTAEVEEEGEAEEEEDDSEPEVEEGDGAAEEVTADQTDGNPEGCQEGHPELSGPDDDPDLAQYVQDFNEDRTPWCEAGGEKQLTEDTFFRCPAANEGEAQPDRFQLSSDGPDSPLLFAFSPAFRFHPADEEGKDPEDRAYPIEFLGDSPGVREVHVVDRGDHGLFISRIIYRQTGVQPTYHQVGVSGNLVGDVELGELLNDIPRGSIINLSLGTYVCDIDKWNDSATRAAILVHIEGGTTFVVSAGNSESDQESWPAAMSLGHSDHVWSVGATTTGEGGQIIRSCYSNYGDWVTAWARGDEIEPDPEVVTTAEGKPMTWSGTSFAAPQVLAQIVVNEKPSNTQTPPNPDLDYDDGNGNLTSCDPAFGYRPGLRLPS